MATILVTGGAGYIGAHTCMALASAGHLPVVYDNLTSGHERFARWGPLEVGDIRDAARLQEIIARHHPEAVVHFAGLIEVGRSVVEPGPFYDQNVGGTITLLNALEKYGVRNFVFSSTCAIFGAPMNAVLAENHPTKPLNPYGRTKLIAEEISRDFSVSHGMKFAHLRYFNAAGAAPRHGLGEWHEPETHALPLAIMAALGKRPDFTLFGTDYDTPDGSCIRDYVHVLDLADAHVAAVERLLDGGDSLAVNLGTGRGVSVLELLDTVARAAGRPVPTRRSPRRAGDPPRLVADNRLAGELLAWRPRRSFEDCVTSAITWHRDFSAEVLSLDICGNQSS